MNTLHRAIVIGSSAGGLKIIEALLARLPANYIPIIIVQHIREDSDCFLANFLNSISVLRVKEAEHNEVITTNHVYIAPPGYHLLIEDDKTFSLSLDERVNYSRPSVDVLFESAADVFSKNLIGIILSGANSDGAEGLKCIKDHGGLCIVQDPLTAESSFMPDAAIEATPVDYIFTPSQMIDYLSSLTSTELKL